MANPQGIVLFAHGSRDERWRAPVDAVAHCLAVLDPSAQVACAFLELIEPDLHAAAAGLIARGARAIRIVPLFLGMGKHVREDLPRLLDIAKSSSQGGFEQVFQSANGRIGATARS